MKVLIPEIQVQRVATNHWHIHNEEDDTHVTVYPQGDLFWVCPCEDAECDRPLKGWNPRPYKSASNALIYGKSLATLRLHPAN